MKKILLYVSELTVSGSPNSTLRLARALKKNGYEVETWSYADGPFHTEYDNYGINIRIVKPRELREQSIIKEIKKFDLLIANSILTDEAFDGISSIIPSIWYIREAENIPSFFRYEYKRGHVLLNCKQMLVVSEYANDYVRKYFNKNVKILHNCVDDVYEKCTHIEKSNKVKVIMIGTIEKRKNFALLVDSFLGLPEEIKEKMELHLVGRTLAFEKSYGNYVISKVNNDNIFYYGEIENKMELMNLISQMDVLAVVSSDESCSLTALEGAMMGKPLILSQNIGAKYLVSQENGWIVETDNENALKNVLKDVLAKRDNLVDMGKISRKKYLNTSTFEIYCQNVEKLVKNILTNKFLYRIHNYKKYISWICDETTKYYSYPIWGSEEPREHLYSYDIFDTLITRDVGSPMGIFAIMQAKLLSDEKYSNISSYVKENFISLRIGAEGFARQVYCKNGVEDKTFGQIYDALYSCGRLSEQEIDQIKELELEIEYEHTIGIQKNIDKLKQMVYEGKKVVLISDMYLSADFIRKLLVKEDSIFENIKIYVSSECRYMKHSTNLFKYVQEKEKVSFSNWTHVGDNDIADISAPQKMGITCIKYSGTDIFDYEKEILKLGEKDLFVQQNIGISKVLLAKSSISKEKNNKIICACHLIVPFIDNCINYAKSNGLKTVYCTNEFGRILFLIGKEMFEKYEIKLKYIPWFEEWYTSCQMDISNKLIFLLCNKKIFLSELCDQLNISKEEIDIFIKRINADLIEINQENILFHLASDKDFVELIQHKISTNIVIEEGLFVDFMPCKYYLPQLREMNNRNKIVSYFFTKVGDIQVNKLRYGFFVDLETDEKKICESIVYNTLFGQEKYDEIREILSTYVHYNYNEMVNTKGRISNNSFIKKLIKTISTQSELLSVLYPEDKYECTSFGLQDCILVTSFVNNIGLFNAIKVRLMNSSEQQFSKSFINDFVSLRMEAEEKAIKAYREKRIDIKDLKAVYDIVGLNEKLNKNQKKYLVDLEYDTLRRNVYGVQENIHRIRRILNANRKAIIIADTVYSKQFLEELLCKIDPIFKNVQLFVTSSGNYFFNSKEYFTTIQKTINVSKDEWYHIGNSIQFDINGSKALSLNGEKYNHGMLLPYEKAAVYEHENDIDVQTMIGIARNNRLLFSGTKEQIIGNSLGGPMLYPYVQWVLDDASKRNIEVLLFVARDGYVLKQIADIIIKKRGLKIKTQYIYGSRKAWRMPSYTADEKLDVFFQMAHIDQLSNMESFSRIFNIPVDKLVEYLPQKYQDINMKLVKEDYKNIREYLEANQNFKMLLENMAELESKKIVKYFEAICNGQQFAFVELSGTGATQNCIAKILNKMTSNMIISYFLNLDGLDHRDNAIFLNYVPNNFFYSWIIENLCRAPHGQTIGYIDDGGKIIPVLSETKEADALLGHGYLSYIYGIMQYAKSYSGYLQENSFSSENSILFQKYLQHMTYNPCKEIKDFIGDMPFEATGFASKVSVFAPKLTEQQMRDIYLTKKDEESIDVYYDGACIDFSLQRMNKEEIDKINFFKNSVATKYGRKARIKRYLRDNGLKKTVFFVCKRIVREILLRCNVIKY